MYQQLNRGNGSAGAYSNIATRSRVRPCRRSRRISDEEDSYCLRCGCDHGKRDRRYADSGGCPLRRLRGLSRCGRWTGRRRHHWRCRCECASGAGLCRARAGLCGAGAHLSRRTAGLVAALSGLRDAAGARRLLIGSPHLESWPAHTSRPFSFQARDSLVKTAGAVNCLPRAFACRRARLRWASNRPSAGWPSDRRPAPSA